MNKITRTAIILSLVTLSLFAIIFVFRNISNSYDNNAIVSPVGTSTPPNSSTEITGTGTTDIFVDSIIPNQVIQSPIAITGKAKGYYFEASFPVELQDSTGKILFQGPAQAQSDWMTSEFVPFKITISFTKPTTSTGTLIFRKDNPSGLPEYDRAFIVPVQFKNEEREVTLYYYNQTKDKDANGNILCSVKGLVGVRRKIDQTSSPLSDTMRLFLKGELTETEKNRGITTEYPLLGVSLKKVTINPNGLTTFSLVDPNNKTSGGACRVSILKEQFEATARQFPTVKNIQYTTAVFQP